ncbi:hypothetical protein KI387_001948, partial [Taxus chinensis]
MAMQMAMVLAAPLPFSLPRRRHCLFLARFNFKGWHMERSEGELISELSQAIPNESLGFVVNAMKYGQNVDLPLVLPKRKKKPYPRPIKEIRRDARETTKRSKLEEAKMEEQALEPPENGLEVPDLIPVAHQVLEARKTLVKNLVNLLDVVPVFAC